MKQRGVADRPGSLSRLDHAGPLPAMVVMNALDALGRQGWRLRVPEHYDKCEGAEQNPDARIKAHRSFHALLPLPDQSHAADPSAHPDREVPIAVG